MCHKILGNVVKLFTQQTTWPQREESVLEGNYFESRCKPIFKFNSGWWYFFLFRSWIPPVVTGASRVPFDWSGWIWEHIIDKHFHRMNVDNLSYFIDGFWNIQGQASGRYSERKTSLSIGKTDLLRPLWFGKGIFPILSPWGIIEHRETWYVKVARATSKCSNFGRLAWAHSGNNNVSGWKPQLKISHWEWSLSKLNP